jgi:WD repeat-containing protein 61
LDSSLRLWDLASGEKVGSIDVGPVDIWTVAFSPDDKFIISGSHSGKIALYGVESAKQEQTLDTRGKFTLSIAYVSRELIYQKYSFSAKSAFS